MTSNVIHSDQRCVVPIDTVHATSYFSIGGFFNQSINLYSQSITFICNTSRLNSIQASNSRWFNNMTEKWIPYIDNTISKKVTISRKSNMTLSSFVLLPLVWQVLERFKNWLGSIPTNIAIFVYCTVFKIIRYSSTLDVPNCCCSKGSGPYWSNPLFLIFDIRALWRSGLSARAPKCQKLKIVG